LAIKTGALGSKEFLYGVSFECVGGAFWAMGAARCGRADLREGAASEEVFRVYGGEGYVLAEGVRDGGA
jgi:hypothetical protein